jgi:hypothetical protein
MTFEAQEEDATTMVKAYMEFKTGSKWKPLRKG